jgi:hypothetical protein
MTKVPQILKSYESCISFSPLIQLARSDQLENPPAELSWYRFSLSGPEASRVELDFSQLMRTGKLASPTISNPGYVPPDTRKKVLHYQLCPSRDTESKKRTIYTTGKMNLLRHDSRFNAMTVLIISFFSQEMEGNLKQTFSTSSPLSSLVLEDSTYRNTISFALSQYYWTVLKY